MKSMFIAVVLLVTGFDAAAAAPSGLAPKCADMRLGGEAVSTAYVDNGENGASIGDVRIVKWRLSGSLTDASADMHVIATVVDAPGDGDWTAIADAVIRFANGTIRLSGETTLADPSDTAGPDGTADRWAVLGGTGAFAGARGTMEATASDAGRHAIVLSIDCAGAATVPDIRLLAPPGLPRVRPVVPPPAARPERPLVQPPLGEGRSRPGP